ncbi:MAG: TldD/PmbA family protein [Acidimicrobiales bacterium]
MAEVLDLANRIAAMARPGEEVEAYIARGRTVVVRAYEGDVESFTSSQTAGVGIRIVRARRQGFAWAGTLDEGVVLDTLAEARDNAAFGEIDEHNGLARLDGVPVVGVDLWREGLVTFPDHERIARALELERAVKEGDPRIAGVRTATYGDRAGEGAVATSNGIGVWERATTCWVSVTALARDGDETEVGVGVDVARQPSELDVDGAAADAVDRATRLLGATKPASQRLTVVFEPRMAAAVLGIVAGTLSGEAVLKGRSPFADRVRETIASPSLTMVDDPTDARSLAAYSHDGEGLAARRNTLIDGGVLQGFLHDSYTGRRSGTDSTGSAVRGVRSTPTPGVQALSLAPGDRSTEELLAGVERGILVQSMTGLHSGVNPVSGDFSVGVEGLMIRDGARAEPVREVTIASTLQRLLLDIRAVGAELEWLPGGSGMATVVIDDVSLSGR